MIIIRAITAIGIVVFGFLIYPYYNDSVIAPLVSVAESLHPGMNVLEQTWLNVIPFVIFLMILYFGIMTFMGRIGLGKKSDEEGNRQL